ncbi:type ISP restriction/modification enzyme [Curtobacterium sp. WHRI 8282]|uniref:type ISP restriction/modification enzyme n=1 Tax=Curtobacterium sp. WHRI 8282 TaxID=3162559 RepID=UPI0032EBA60F
MDIRNFAVCSDSKVSGVSEDFAVADLAYPATTNTAQRLTEVAGIPAEAHDYELGSRSAHDWILERYQVKTDKASGIANDWGVDTVTQRISSSWSNAWSPLASKRCTWCRPCRRCDTGKPLYNPDRGGRGPRKRGGAPVFPHELRATD